MESNITINWEYIEKPEYTKLPLSIEEQVDLLKARWLSFSNEEHAKKRLNRTSYYRLSAYTRFLTKWTDHFPEWSEFKDITDLYSFDWDLKILLIEALEIIENSLKAKITNTVAVKSKTWFWLMDKKNFISNQSFQTVQNVVEKDLEKNRKNSDSIVHYYKKYSWPSRPPCRMLMEILSFGNVCSIYKALNNSYKSAIAWQYGVRHQQLESRIVALSYLRNICAHSDRLWNRVLWKKITTIGIEEYVTHIKKAQDGTLEFQKIYIYLLVISYLLFEIDETFWTTWIWKLISLISKKTRLENKTYYMWFPTSWEDVLGGKITLTKSTKKDKRAH